MCCAVLSSSVSEYEVHLCLVLVESTSAHLTFCNLLFSTMVLLVDLVRHFSCRSCFHNDVLDVNRGDVVAVLDASFPPGVHLRSSENIIVLPSAEYRRMDATFLCSSFGVHGFCMVFLPLIVSVHSSL